MVVVQKRKATRKGLTVGPINDTFIDGESPNYPVYFLKEDYYVQEIDLSNLFCFGVVLS
jgi:hypothetical protein